jgi:hypothetical protein
MVRRIKGVMSVSALVTAPKSPAASRLRFDVADEHLKVAFTLLAANRGLSCPRAAVSVLTAQSITLNIQVASAASVSKAKNTCRPLGRVETKSDCAGPGAAPRASQTLQSQNREIVGKQPSIGRHRELSYRITPRFLIIFIILPLE